MSRHLLQLFVVSCVISLSVHVSLHDPDADKTLARYRQRVKMVHELLLAEGCPDPDMRVKRRAPEDARSEIQIEIEKAFFDELVKRLADCRQKNSTLITPTRTMPSTTTQKPRTNTTSTTTSTTTTTTPTARTTHFHQPGECEVAINLTESWRHELSPRDQKPVKGVYNCDPWDMTNNGRKWFRFTGSAGNRLLDHCIPDSRCGTHATLWSNATMPSAVGVSTTIPLYGSLRRKCDYFSYTFSVMKCSNNVNDYIYRWSSSSTDCSLGFCGMS